MSAPVALGGTANATLNLFFSNLTNVNASWIAGPQDDPACPGTAPADPWLSLNPPFAGQIPPQAVAHPAQLGLTMTAGAHARGIWRAYVCVVISPSALGIPRFTIPVNMAVDDVIFEDGFEAGSL